MTSVGEVFNYLFDQRHSLARLLSFDGYDVECVATGGELLDRLDGLLAKGGLGGLEATASQLEQRIGHFEQMWVTAMAQSVAGQKPGQAALAVVRAFLRATGQRRVTLNGGVFANVKLNQRIREVPGVEEVFVYPNMGDGGCGTGAALVAFGPAAFGQPPLENVYFGPDFTEVDMEGALMQEGLHYERPAEIEERIEERIREAYPQATMERLREVKRRYDPENLFRINHNIPPARG